MLTKLRKETRYFPKIFSTFSDQINLSKNIPQSANIHNRALNAKNPVGHGSLPQGSQLLIFQMQLIDGISLFKFQKHNLCIHIDIVRYFAAQALVIIDYLQSYNIIYRDIKPENFILEFDTGKLKLVDFGFAKELNFKSTNMKTRGRTFTKCGTPEYMAPEIIQ